ncbi:hypothetical protein AQUCO_00600091v1 [Aquilegia coerulea]|uniref:Uncharacterized protein n=1 Tax=Aquilegia coerulea TaxID=218851 RepID=A0A2G5EN08_AQUCA|nr:hypothetical protein AQUCO_00600091v1 [Aquilegia coerulea]
MSKADSADLPSLFSTPLTFNTMVHMVSVKLGANNYLLWRNQFIPLLTSQNLIGYVDGSTTQPSRTTIDANNKTIDNTAYAVWKQADQLVMSLLYSSLTEEAMSEVLGLTCAADVWKTLEEVFSYKSKSREIQLKDELQLMKKGTQSVDEYSRKFKLVCDQLAAMGKPVDDTDKVHWFLRGLGSEFRSFSTSVLSRPPLPTFKEIVPTLQSNELFLKSLPATSASHDAAYIASRGGRSGYRGGRNFGRGGNHNGGNQSHYKSNNSNSKLKVFS